jgi:hypothetical protein
VLIARKNGKQTNIINIRAKNKISVILRYIILIIFVCLVENIDETIRYTTDLFEMIFKMSKSVQVILLQFNQLFLVHHCCRSSRTRWTFLGLFLLESNSSWFIRLLYIFYPSLRKNFHIRWSGTPQPQLEIRRTTYGKFW